METITARNAARQDFLPLMRELVRCYQAFASFDASLHRESGLGLTVSQADVLFTLGNTKGMTCKEIGERTLITKGTLTGVMDRLEAKGLLKRTDEPSDRRCIRVVLTDRGREVFEQEFPRQITALKQRFDRLSTADKEQARQLLRAIREIF